MFSEDVDLLVITHEWLLAHREFSGLVFARQLRVTIGQAVSDLHLIAEILDSAEMRNRIEYIPL